MTPEEAFGEAFKQAFGSIFHDVGMMLLFIILLLGLAAAFGIWLEWKLYGRNKWFT